jgi:hypothetical protein
MLESQESRDVSDSWASDTRSAKNMLYIRNNYYNAYNAMNYSTTPTLPFRRDQGPLGCVGFMGLRHSLREGDVEGWRVSDSETTEWSLVSSECYNPHSPIQTRPRTTRLFLNPRPATPRHPLRGASGRPWLMFVKRSTRTSMRSCWRVRKAEMCRIHGPPTTQ